MYLLEYKVQLLRAAARYLGGRGGEGPMAVPDCMRAVHEKAKCPEFSGARVEISGARLEFQEAQVVVRGAAQGRWAEVAGHCDKGPGQRRGQAGEVSGAERGIAAQRRGVGCGAGAVWCGRCGGIVEEALERCRDCSD